MPFRAKTSLNKDSITQEYIRLARLRNWYLNADEGLEYGRITNTDVGRSLVCFASYLKATFTLMGRIRVDEVPFISCLQRYHDSLQRQMK